MERDDENLVVKSEYGALRTVEQFETEVRIQNLAAQGGFSCPIIASEAKLHDKKIWSVEPPEQKMFYNLVMPKMAFSLEEIMQRYLFLDYETVTKITI